MRITGRKKTPIRIAAPYNSNGISDHSYIKRVFISWEVLLQGKWRIHILCAVRSGPVRLGQLARVIPNASKKMLTQNLRSLEGAGVVIRRDLSDLLLHVEYDLDPSVRDSVCQLLDELSKWGGLYLQCSIDGRHFPKAGVVESASRTNPGTDRDLTAVPKYQSGQM